GFAPAGRPRIAFAVLIEHGGHGGEVAAPVAMEIVHGYFETVAPDQRNAPRLDLPRRRLTRETPPAERQAAAAATNAPGADATRRRRRLEGHLLAQAPV